MAPEPPADNGYEGEDINIIIALNRLTIEKTKLDTNAVITKMDRLEKKYIALTQRPEALAMELSLFTDPVFENLQETFIDSVSIVKKLLAQNDSMIEQIKKLGDSMRDINDMEDQIKAMASGNQELKERNDELVQDVAQLRKLTADRPINYTDPEVYKNLPEWMKYAIAHGERIETADEMAEYTRRVRSILDIPTPTQLIEYQHRHSMMKDVNRLFRRFAISIERATILRNLLKEKGYNAYTINEAEMRIHELEKLKNYLEINGYNDTRTQHELAKVLGKKIEKTPLSKGVPESPQLNVSKTMREVTGDMDDYEKNLENPGDELEQEDDLDETSNNEGNEKSRGWDDKQDSKIFKKNDDVEEM